MLYPPVGLNQATPASALQKNSLTLRTVGDGGTVWTDPGGGSIPGGSQVVLYMGEAVPTDQVQVPSVIGLTAEQARQKLADAVSTHAGHRSHEPHGGL